MIRLHNITAGYENNIIFENYSLTLPERGVVSITGPSGRGKSTLLRVLASLLKTKSGGIEGLDLLRVSMVFQENRLLPWRTALENIALPLAGSRRVSEAIALEWLDKMELLDERNTYPAALSGGMQRRVALARAAAYQGDLLLLDEPFTGLDSLLRDRVATQLQSAAPLIVLVSHDADDARAMGASITITL